MPETDPKSEEELYELVKQWPEEARPKSVGVMRNYGIASVTTKHRAEDYPLAHAIDLHTTSGIRWLLARKWCISQYDKESHGKEDFCLMDDGDRASVSPTLFLALHAAIMATKGDSNAQ